MKTQTDKIKVGIMGGAGYTGGELLRLLINHPLVEISFVHSRSLAGTLVSEVHTDLFGETNLKFTDRVKTDPDVLFFCVGHNETKKILSEIKFSETTKIIDLSQDFRSNSSEHNFVYGLPELNKEKIARANNIANPGCFATAIQLALLPLAEKKSLQSDIHISCTTGSTGAGQSLSASSHFSWRQNNLSVYKAFTHQHLAEINNSLKQLQPTFNEDTVMIPQRGSFTRGILASVNIKSSGNLETLQNLFKEYYKDHPFVHVSKSNIDLKQVVNTNKCLLYLEKHADQLLIISVIDNLLKGSSGQALQNMNLMFGLEETMGLKLKASAF
jgi:N-acetyl-gamma-glutamyl-phosphate reductase